MSRANNGQLTATTAQAAAFGNLIVAVPDGTTFGELATIESGFSFATGTCAAGSPRFVVFLDNGRCPFAAFPSGGDCADGQGSTGDLTQNNDPFVWNDDLCGGSGLETNTYDEVLALYQNESIDRIVVVVDESGGEQTVTLNPCVTVVQSERFPTGGRAADTRWSWSKRCRTACVRFDILPIGSCQSSAHVAAMEWRKHVVADRAGQDDGSSV